MRKLIITALLALTVMVSGGCASITSDTGTFAVQYATIKLIERSDDINAQQVLDTTNKVRGIVEDNGGEITMSTLTSSFHARVDISSLQPSDQLLVTAIIARIQSTIYEKADDKNYFSIKQTTTVLQLLDDIDEAAMIYGE